MRPRALGRRCGQDGGRRYGVEPRSGFGITGEKASLLSYLGSVAQVSGREVPSAHVPMTRVRVRAGACVRACVQPSQPFLLPLVSAVARGELTSDAAAWLKSGFALPSTLLTALLALGAPLLLGVWLDALTRLWTQGSPSWCAGCWPWPTLCLSSGGGCVFAAWQRATVTVCAQELHLLEEEVRAGPDTAEQAQRHLNVFYTVLFIHVMATGIILPVLPVAVLDVFNGNYSVRGCDR